jgi:hypothetical protein
MRNSLNIDICRQILGMTLVVAMVGCSDADIRQEIDNSSNATIRNEPVMTDAWLGRWIGAEGTYLDIRGGDGVYELTIANLDGPIMYVGNGVEEGITFQRNEVTEVIRATDGAGTGMKWLAEKTNCLVIQPGEGFCMD